MNSSAPGQFLGSALQFPRALYHLLKCGPGGIVCVEVLGDVATIMADNQLLIEEDKSSVNSNPLTNKSTDLWKTFYNWIKAVKNNEIIVNKTNFILFTNQTGRNGIVNTFDSAQTLEEAKLAIANAKQVLKDIDQKHDIWPFYNFVVNQEINILIEVILKFELQIGSLNGYNEVRDELVRILLPRKQIPFILNFISGWLQQEVITKISKKELAKVTWEEFEKQTAVVFDRARRRELIDFTLQDPIKEDDIQQQVKIQPTYLKQLEAIDCDDDDILEAVADFLRAKVNRDKWIEDEIIDESVAKEFYEKLHAYWKNEKQGIDITQKQLDKEQKGKLLLAHCKNRQTLIRNEEPPNSTIAGTYHSLADEPVLGWHPDWESFFKHEKVKKHE
jgi:hypothetical protein